MKKYTKPAIEFVELSVKESLSALPGNFGEKGFAVKGVGQLSGYARKIVTMYARSSQTPTTVN